jgi:hypothetical protein
MGLAKYFEERIERFMTNADEIRRDFSGQKAIYGPEIVEQKAHAIQRAMRNLCDELLSIVTNPEYQDALALEELALEMKEVDQRHQEESKENQDTTQRLKSQLIRLQSVLNAKELYLENLKVENAELHDTVRAKETKIANIHSYYKNRIEKADNSCKPADELVNQPEGKAPEKELSFRELLEIAANSASINDKRDPAKHS